MSTLPHQFKDSAGNLYTVNINVAIYMDLKANWNVDITDTLHTKGGWISEMLSHGDMSTFLGVLCVVTDKERLERGISDETFFANLGGDEIGAATEALIEGIINFSPVHQRDPLRKIMKTMDQTLEQASSRVCEKADEIMAKIPEMVEEQLESHLRDDK